MKRSPVRNPVTTQTRLPADPDSSSDLRNNVSPAMRHPPSNYIYESRPAIPVPGSQELLSSGTQTPSLTRGAHSAARLPAALG